jgi:hypothetical protein
MKLSMTRKLLLVLVLIPSGLMRAESDPVACQSSEQPTALVELYTSEGCSSCPPAERWLSEQKESPRLWKDFVPVAFHVDYWNSLGWRDPWSNAEASQRQNAYARLWRTESIYTPEFVLNGAEWPSSWTRRALPALPDAKVGVLTAKLTGTNHWQINFTPSQMDGAGYEVNLALTESGVSSDVKAGENRGRKLVHDFAVLKVVKEKLSLRDGSWCAQVAVPLPNSTAGRPALAVWVNRTGQMQPVQATGCWLRPPPK